MPLLIGSPGCDGCIRLSQKVLELERSTSILDTAQNPQARCVYYLWPDSCCHHQSCSACGLTAGSPNGLRAPNPRLTSAAEEERWFQQAAKLKAPISSNPVLSGTWSKVGPSRGRVVRSCRHRSPPTCLLLTNCFRVLNLDFPCLMAPGSCSSGGLKLNPSR